jgi:hypothetical protein
MPNVALLDTHQHSGSPRTLCLTSISYGSSKLSGVALALSLGHGPGLEKENKALLRTLAFQSEAC